MVSVVMSRPGRASAVQVHQLRVAAVSEPHVISLCPHGSSSSIVTAAANVSLTLLGGTFYRHLFS